MVSGLTALDFKLKVQGFGDWGMQSLQDSGFKAFYSKPSGLDT